MDMSPRDLTQLGQFIAQHRKQAGFSQEALAAEAKVADTTILRLERGEFARPDPEKLERIARALGFDAEDLFALAGYVAPGGLPTFGPYLRTKGELPEEAQQKLLTYYEQIKQEYAEDADAESDR